MSDQMKKKQRIQLVPGAHIPCLRIWCGACRTMTKVCRKSDGDPLPLSQCENIHALQYKFVAFVPGTKQRIVRSLGKDFNEAVKQVAILRQQLENGTIEVVQKKAALPEKETPVRAIASTKPELLTHLLGKHLSMLQGEGIAPHLVVSRSKGHLTDVKNCYKQFCVALSNAGYDLGSFRLSDISDEAVGAYHNFLIVKGLSNASYNRFFSHLTTFASWCAREGYGDVKRFFERVPRKTVTPRPEVIAKEEFEKVLSVVSHEHGFQYGIGKKKETRNHFREYLVSAFRFALYTGRRLEEIITVRFSNVHTDENGNPLYVTFTDHKVSRILHVEPGQERVVHTPVTKEIAAFLNEQGFQQKRNTDDFILAPEVTQNRVSSMRLAISRGFSHFWKVAYPDATREISFKALRKTHLTNLAIRMGKDVRSVSGHSSEQVLRYYVDAKQVAIAESLRDFSVFGKEEELKTQRKSRGTSQSIER